MPRAKESTAGASTAQAQQEAVSDGIDNFELPRSLIMKLARASQVPENTKFSKEVILAILKASTVFINYLAATAHEVATSKQHKSISATDVLKALELVELADIAQNIQGELPLYRDLQKSDKRKGGKGKAKDASESASAGPKKGKGKAAASATSDPAAPGPAPTIHIPAVRPAVGPSAAEQSEDIDEDQEMADADQDQGEEQEQEQEQDEAEDEEIDEDEEDDDEDEAEPPEDIMAVEEEELRRDAKGLEAVDRDEAIDED
ncbi:histone-fold-containing protein [Lentinus brumalis]|uniref:DNA polymerase epsilon subunit D n=1 Tax=Lentinus brumalis TaxID=2498619 RepID=A0A371CWH0_9APHY|nr:histone-fold-containing protein [Polyporus brumalis]